MRVKAVKFDLRAVTLETGEFSKVQSHELAMASFATIFGLITNPAAAETDSLAPQPS